VEAQELEIIVKVTYGITVVVIVYVFQTIQVCQETFVLIAQVVPEAVAELNPITRHVEVIKLNAPAAYGKVATADLAVLM
jgi:hypothetical protein